MSPTKLYKTSYFGLPAGPASLNTDILNDTSSALMRRRSLREIRTGAADSAPSVFVRGDPAARLLIR